MKGAARLTIVFAALAAAAGSAAAPPSDTQYYTLADFPKVQKIDAHVHLSGPADQFMGLAARDNFWLLTINADYPDLPPIPQQQLAAVSLRQRYPSRLEFAGTFSVADFNSPGWQEAALVQIRHALAEGAVGIKIWKNIGMALQDPAGHYVMPDDARLEPIISRLERDHIVLLGHQAEPRNCWLPPERMTVLSDRQYFEAHPQNYMYRHPDMPSQGSILAARDRMLRAHPNLSFVAVHLASLEWNVDKVAAFLERFPQASVDLAARIVHLQYQAAQDPQKVRRFLIRYQDRILYGSDEAYGPEDRGGALLAEVHGVWLEDWRFLATGEPMRSSDFAAAFHGLHLPQTVLDKIYRRNAQRIFVTGWSGAGGLPREPKGEAR